MAKIPNGFVDHKTSSATKNCGQIGLITSFFFKTHQMQYGNDTRLKTKEIG